MSLPLAPRAAAPDRLAALEAHLEAAFRDIAATRMAGVPVLNPRLQVRALGFEPCADEAGMSLGVLLTPWFMNLLRWPLAEQGAEAEGAEGAKGAEGPGVGSAGALSVPLLRPGHTGEREIGGQRLTFTGAELPGLGCFEQCSLFSPMFEFADQAAAVATAQEVLRLLRAAPVAPPRPEVLAGRRSFLFGRSAGAAARG